jgi:hypothetical protein
METVTMAEYQALKAQLEAIKAANMRKLTLKVSEKGGVSVYGINSRFPITLYRNQWERLLDSTPAIKQFLIDNASQLKEKI